MFVREESTSNSNPSLFWEDDGYPPMSIQFKQKIIMAIKLEKYQGGESTLISHGTVVETTGVDGSISFIRKNFNNPDKRVALLLKNKKGESRIISCSEPLSKEIRSGKITVSEIFGLEIIETEEGVMFVSMPATGAIQTFEAKKYKVKEYASSDEFVPEDLIG